ncbi:tetratricopeptide repeat protein, partial [Akkermansia sp.]|uniref:tetratricopeptide repeat protein n=1 Tax=Akkermansia sp. TaxID=1872421 RepID=UPI0025B7BCC6
VERDGSNAGWKRDLTVSLNRMGDLRLSQEKEGEAEEYFRESLGIMRELVERDGSNVGWKKDLVISLKRMANLRVLQEQEEEAEKLYKEARDIQHALE